MYSVIYTTGCMLNYKECTLTRTERKKPINAKSKFEIESTRAETHHGPKRCVEPR